MMQLHISHFVSCVEEKTYVNSKWNTHLQIVIMKHSPLTPARWVPVVIQILHPPLRDPLRMS